MKRNLMLAAAFLISTAIAFQDPETPEVKAIRDQIGGLRKLGDGPRAKATLDLALRIRKLPPSYVKVGVAGALCNLSTEGDFGRSTLQEVANTLAMAMNDDPPPPLKGGEPNYNYTQLAQLARYEGIKVSLKPELKSNLKWADDRLAKLDKIRNDADFTLTDMAGKIWTRKALKGKVVLVNFWATWCPPCRKEMPDLEALYHEFKDKGLVILAISDETEKEVAPFIKEHKYTYPVLLDPGRKVNELYQVDGIPKNFIYNREGKLAAQAIDMRTKGQFLKLLAKAGLK